MKIRFLFYRAKFEWRNFIKTRRIHLVDDAISWWTWFGNIGTEPYAHAEVWTPISGSCFTNGLKGQKFFTGTCWTSTMRGEAKGTCKRPASEVLTHPERWDYIEFDIAEDLFFAGKLWMNCQIRDNKGYGFRDIGKFFGLGFMADKYRNICSEFTHNYAVITGILSQPYKVVSPRRFSRMLPGKMQKLAKGLTLGKEVDLK